MNPITHFLVGWVVANSSDLNQRERTAVTISGIIPDVDAAGIIVEKLTFSSDKQLLWWTDYHHVITHNIGFCILVSLIVFALSKKRWTAMGLAALSFHLHLLGDILGAKGPEGYQWPIPYLLPFSNSLQVVWAGQWAINAWPNIVITSAFLILSFYLAWKRGFSFIGIISASADKTFIETLRNRFGRPKLPTEII